MYIAIKTVYKFEKSYLS